MATFDQIWVDNRFRYRKTLRGSRLRLCEATGYLEPSDRRGFSAEMRATFIKRLRVCSNMSQIAKSCNITIQTIYDAIAVDPKFRADVIDCNKVNSDGIDTRSKRLNDEMVKLAASEKTTVLLELRKEAEKYLGNK